MRRIGLLGGTFDPVHAGHVAMAYAALEEGIDHLIVMPCKLSPHKAFGSSESKPAPDQHRWNMLQLAMPYDTRVELSVYELDGPDYSFTWQSLDYLKSIYPQDRIVLVIGEDQYDVLDTWAKFQEWRTWVEILVFKREGMKSESLLKEEAILATWSKINIPTVSATDLRHRLAHGLEMKGLLPEGVAEYIEREGLYLKN
ncbi:MAG: nicotinate (nicotinamide) nucleotide adenylyltransferase [Blastochloris sp.]|nr:nicotinate (nicotinamide) nucleotide adenylyltransferase [Blastochloris sp.]